MTDYYIKKQRPVMGSYIIIYSRGDGVTIRYLDTEDELVEDAKELMKEGLAITCFRVTERIDIDKEP